MDPLTLQALEFDQVLQIVAGYTLTAAGRRQLTQLRPQAAYQEVSRRLEEVAELQAQTVEEGPLSLGGCPDLEPLFPRLAIPGSILSPEDFLQILEVLKLTQRLKRQLLAWAPRRPRLAGYGQELRELPEIQQAIQRTISPHGLILDKASPELARLRREIQQLKQQLTRRLQQLLQQPEYLEARQDQVISQRNGRFVIPIKAEFKGRIPGIIHDQSQSRATLFLEPLAIVDLNNSLNLLLNEEKREIDRILLSLTYKVRAHLDLIRRNLELIGVLDCLQAKVQFGRDFQAIVPELTRQGKVSLRQARHPLLVARERQQPGAPPAVPIDLELTPTARFLVLSGANTGGKTASLKTLGLLCLMVQSGLPIPVAEGSEVCVFDSIFADIGDTQDLAGDLSTFSAHIKRVAEILARLQGRSLVLLDELGTATDPTEGSALALALLKALGRAGAYGMVTTHYHLLKAWAAEEPGFANAAMLFDEATRRPLYRLAYGVAGASNALSIARELGLPETVLADAEAYLGQEGLEALQQLAKCETLQQRLAAQEQRLQEEWARLRQAEAELERRRQELAAEAVRLRDQQQAEIKAAIRAAEAEFKAILSRLERGQESWGRARQQLTARQRQLQALLPDLPPVAASAEFQPEIGQQVYIPALGQTGVITGGPNREGRWEVLTGAVKLRLLARELQEVKGGEGQPRLFSTRGAGAAALTALPTWESTSLNIIGLRVEEALPLVDRLLDQAILHGCRQVDIIHGVGTGRLREAVQEHLKRHALVKKFHPGPQHLGGQGVTIVEIKD